MEKCLFAQIAENINYDTEAIKISSNFFLK